MRAFNERLARGITQAVSTMTCAYIFAGLALMSLPSVIQEGTAKAIVAWVAQTFLQLVLLSVIMVGQKLSSDTHASHVEDLHQRHDEHHALLEQVHALLAPSVESEQSAPRQP